MTSYKLTGLGDVFLEHLLSVALEKTGEETGMVPSDEPLSLLVSAVGAAKHSPSKKLVTVCLMRNFAQALKAAGWGDQLAQSKTGAPGQ